MDGTKVLVAAIPVVEGARLDFKTPLVEAGFEVLDLGARSRKGDADLIEALQRTEVLIPGNLLCVDEELLADAPCLKLIAKPGAGLDNIDLAAATRRGIPVCHTPGVNAQSVADHTWALILNLMRRVNMQDRSVRREEWRKVVGVQAWRKRLGIIGVGAIGRAVAARARGFEMEVMAYDPFWPDNLGGIESLTRTSLDELLRMADIVSIHCPLTDDTRGMISAPQLALMQRTAVLINTARGHIVDEDALADALSRGLIAGAGLDAFAREPLSRHSPLSTLPNVILTPHTAWLSKEVIDATVAETVGCIRNFLNGKKPRHPANPEVLEGLGPGGNA
jgi:D-3-phosphoglycerate dehydrogenase / 2-oxoglutarate reductase